MFLSFTALFSFVFSSYQPADYPENIYVSDKNISKDAEIYNLLFIGSDSAFTKSSPQSASLTLLSYSTKKHSLKLSSFDSRICVNIPNTGNKTLNYTINSCSPQLTADTFEFNFGIDINAFVRYDYSDLSKLINAVKGIPLVDIDVEEPESAKKSEFELTTKKVIEATGDQALAYLRAGNRLNTKNGAERLSEIVSAVVKKAFTQNPFSLFSSLKTVVKKTECSIGKKNLYSLSLALISGCLYKTEKFCVPASDIQTGKTKNGDGALVFDFEKNTDNLINFIYG